MKFSTEFQPSPDRRRRQFCRKGHPMADGDPNLFLRANGERLCKACKSETDANRRERKAKILQGIPTPPSLENGLYFDPAYYKHTSLPTLEAFYRWQVGVLAKAKAAADGTVFNIGGAPMWKINLIPTLEKEILITQQAIDERRKSE